MQANPYQTPGANVADGAEQYGEVKILSAAGRLGRVRYIGYSIGMTFLVYFAASALGMLAALAGGGVMFAVVAGLGVIVMLVVGIMLTIQRCHDMNLSGWLSLLMIVPLAPLVFWIVPGTQGSNRFGNPPPPNTTGAVVLALILPVIFVVGILAAIALPAYVDYQKRAQVSQSQ